MDGLSKERSELIPPARPPKVCKSTHTMTKTLDHGEHSHTTHQATPNNRKIIQSLDREVFQRINGDIFQRIDRNAFQRIDREVVQRINRFDRRSIDDATYMLPAGLSAHPRKLHDTRQLFQISQSHPESSPAFIAPFPKQNKPSLIPLQPRPPVAFRSFQRSLFVEVRRLSSFPESKACQLQAP